MSPRASGRREFDDHDGRVITQAPNVMWGTLRRAGIHDSTTGGAGSSQQSNTAERGVRGVARVQSREPLINGTRMPVLRQGLERSLSARWTLDVARGLALRMDHGSQYLSEPLRLKQIRYWGIHPSFGFVEEPETNGVAERWNRYAQGASDPRPRSFRTSRPSGPPWPTSWSGTTQTWRLEKPWVSHFLDRGARGV